MKVARRLLTMLAATAVFGVVVSSASANGQLSSSSQTFRATFARLDFSGGFGTTECNLTVEGSLHSRHILKIASSLYGQITRVITNNCGRGSATVLSELLGWPLYYSAFLGLLPVIRLVASYLVRWAMRIREAFFGVQCLFTSEVGEPVTIDFNRESGGVLTSAVLGGTIETDCGIAGTLSGTSNSLSVLNSSTQITLTLI